MLNLRDEIKGLGLDDEFRNLKWVNNIFSNLGRVYDIFANLCYDLIFILKKKILIFPYIWWFEKVKKCVLWKILLKKKKKKGPVCVTKVHGIGQSERSLSELGCLTMVTFNVGLDFTCFWGNLAQHPGFMVILGSSWIGLF